MDFHGNLFCCFCFSGKNKNDRKGPLKICFSFCYHDAVHDYVSFEMYLTVAKKYLFIFLNCFVLSVQVMAHHS